MPRKSNAALLVPEMPKAEMLRPDVPYDLNENEGAVWNAIVDTMPADYFSPAQVPMLKTLCQMVVEQADAKAKWEAEKAKKKPNEKKLVEKRREWMQTADMVMRLMRSMRLTHQSVYFPQTAASKQANERQHASAANELWEANDEPAE